jgi:hypothetical protein
MHVCKIGARVLGFSLVKLTKLNAQMHVCKIEGNPMLSAARLGIPKMYRYVKTNNPC